MTMLPALYTGRVMHRRVRPKAHRLDYSVFSLLLDIDGIDALARRLRLFSRNRFNLFSFHDRDYGVSGGQPLRSQIEHHLRTGGFAADGGRILLLTIPRVLGYAFNPLSIYFCHRRDGTLEAMLYEVHNTFGERHGYLLPVADDNAETIRQRCRKHFHVSPFMDMEMTYSFRVIPPGERLSVAISAADDDGAVLSAVLTARRQELTDASLARLFLLQPLMALKVTAGIHWEALLIWLKGVGPRHRPPPPSEPVTTG